MSDGLRLTIAKGRNGRKSSGSGRTCPEINEKGKTKTTILTSSPLGFIYHPKERISSKNKSKPSFK